MSERTASSVFVYGSLKKGHGAHYYLRDQEFLGRFELVGPYRMIDLGYYPGVIELSQERLLKDFGSEKRSIFGELYSVQPRVLRDLDRLEGNPTFYRRVQTEIYPGLRAWVYYLPSEYLVQNAKRIIETGCWRPSEEEAEHWHNLDKVVVSGQKA